jgi:hypothetical protein
LGIIANIDSKALIFSGIAFASRYRFSASKYCGGKFAGMTPPGKTDPLQLISLHQFILKEKSSHVTNNVTQPLRASTIFNIIKGG